MATTEKPVILLISGGWHIPESYGKLIKNLESAGHEVHCPRHPSMEQVRPPKAGLAEDTEAIRAYVEKLADSGRRIVAILHSYGGQVGTNALVGLGVEARKKAGKTGGVSDLIYVCGFALPEGGSMINKVIEMGHKDLLPLAFDFADDMTVVSRDPATLIVGPGSEEKELEEFLGTLVRWNGQCMHDKISQCAWKEIPSTYVYTAGDMCVLLDYQKSMVATIEEYGNKVKTYELATGHCPNFTAAKELADIITEVVG